ncbi:hypothetical protein LTR22_010068 [Elasticomyces elasticus]|nr:hypothetical protein LTR22_010068 [Elasticomyces elasticus]
MRASVFVAALASAVLSSAVAIPAPNDVAAAAPATSSTSCGAVAGLLGSITGNGNCNSATADGNGNDSANPGSGNSASADGSGNGSGSGNSVGDDAGSGNSVGNINLGDLTVSCAQHRSRFDPDDHTA